MGEEVADPLAALAVGAEAPLRPDDAALVAVPAAAERAHRDGAAVDGDVGLVEMKAALRLLLPTPTKLTLLIRLLSTP